MQEKYLTVAALTKYIKHKFDTDDHLKEVYLKGEISNFKAHTSGHFYFSLKDADSKINAIMFRGQNRQLKFQPQDGMNFLVKGRVSIYEQMGSYQIYIEEMLEDGLGNLYLAYEQLRKKLESEGLFAKEHKKEIPKFPNKIGVITAQTGAAVRDILTTLKRRYPIGEVYLFPTLVQGKEAYHDVVKKLEQADNFGLDVIILARGGGSIEDLWSFNEEMLARKIFTLHTPVITGVGHETDFTIADFVADMRAPTPTAAAELSVPNVVELIQNVEKQKMRVKEAIKQKINYQRLVLDSAKSSYILKNPMLIYENRKQDLDYLMEKINNYTRENVKNQRQKLNYIRESYVLKRPKNLLMTSKNNLQNIIMKLDLLNPLQILARGYSVTYVNNQVLKDMANVKENDIIETRLNKGWLKSKVIAKEERK